MKKDSFAKLVIFLILCLNALVGYSQSEDFALFIKRFSADTAFQKERVVFPIPQISWDYENDKEKTTPIAKEKYRHQTLFDLNSECADGFYFFYPNTDTATTVKDMVLQISGITDMYVKYYFKLIDNRWFLIKYLDYDL